MRLRYGKEAPEDVGRRIKEINRELQHCASNPSAAARRGDEYIKKLKAELRSYEHN